MRIAYLLMVVFTWIASSKTSAQEIPLVYCMEDTGVHFPKPMLPELLDLPFIRPLPDPFAWSDRSGRSTDFRDWSKFPAKQRMKYGKRLVSRIDLDFRL